MDEHLSQSKQDRLQRFLDDECYSYEDIEAAIRALNALLPENYPAKVTTIDVTNIAAAQEFFQKEAAYRHGDPVWHHAPGLFGGYAEQVGQVHKKLERLATPPVATTL